MQHLWKRRTQLARRKALILGDPNSIFPGELAAIWASYGIEVGIVTRYWTGCKSAQVPVFASSEYETPLQRQALLLLQRQLERLESVVIGRQRNRYERAMGGAQWYRPTFASAVVNGLSIARLVRSIRPDFICGQEVSSYGLATAWCRGIPRILMPWGGDIFMYCDTTTIASCLTTYALRRVDLVVTGAVSSIPYIQSRFGIERARIHYAGCWRLDRKQFQRAPQDQRKKICEKFGFAPENLIIMNVRRFWPGWGSDVALEAFLWFAAREPDAHFVLLGGAGTESHMAAARQRVRAEGLSDRFVILDGYQPLAVCAKLMSVADVFVSLMQKRDMRSASVLQAAAAGGAPVVSDQEEYRCMERDGFSALFVDAEDVTSVVNALQKYARNPELRDRTLVANQAYLTTHENGDFQVRQLLQRVEDICDDYRLRQLTMGYR